MTKTEYDKLRRILVRLTAMRHFAHVVGDGRTVQDLTALLLPFEKVASGASSRLVRSLEIGADAADASGGGGGGDASRGGTATSRGPTANQTLDAFGRSYTSGTRKEASARVYLIPVGAVASALDAVAAARSYRAFLAAERAKDEAQFAERRAAQASGAERMAPTWLAADARQGAELAASNAERKKLGLELAVVPPALAVDANGRLRSPFRAAAEPAPSKRSATDDLTDADAAAVEAEHDRLASAEVARPVVPLALTGPTPPAPSPTNSNAPSSSTERDGTLHFPSGTVAPPNSDPLLGSILINNVPLHRYFSSPKDREAVLRPFVLSRTTGAFNVFATVKQGGTTGQAEALALAIGRGIAVHQPMAKRTLAKCAFWPCVPLPASPPSHPGADPFSPRASADPQGASRPTRARSSAKRRAVPRPARQTPGSSAECPGAIVASPWRPLRARSRVRRVDRMGLSLSPFLSLGPRACERRAD